MYERFEQKGRLAPDGIEYVSSWVTEDITKCYQIMKGERQALQEWIDHWSDLVDFDVITAITSAEAVTKQSDLT